MREQQLIAVALLYVKGHSYGEFVFDDPAQLAGQLGRAITLLLGELLSLILGYRFFIASSEDEGACTALMLRLIDRFVSATSC